MFEAIINDFKHNDYTTKDNIYIYYLYKNNIIA